MYFLASQVLFQNKITKTILTYCVKEMRNAEAIKEDCEFIQCISCKRYSMDISLKIHNI